MDRFQDSSTFESGLSSLPSAKVQSRRHILQLIALAGGSTLMSTGCRKSTTAAGWINVHPDPASAAEIGSLWLRAQRPEPATDDLLTTLAAPGDVASLNAGGIEIIRRHILEKHHADFIAGRVVPVAGWLLSTTEATVYGLLAQLARDVG